MSAKQMCEEFARVLPGRCLICSYWRFGRDHALTSQETPPHDCIENPQKPAGENSMEGKEKP